MDIFGYVYRFIAERGSYCDQLGCERERVSESDGARLGIYICKQELIEEGGKSLYHFR